MRDATNVSVQRAIVHIVDHRKIDGTNRDALNAYPTQMHSTVSSHVERRLQ